MGRKELGDLVTKAQDLVKFEEVKYFNIPISKMSKLELMACLSHSIGLNLTAIRRDKLAEIASKIRHQREGMASRRLLDPETGKVYTEAEIEAMSPEDQKAVKERSVPEI